MKRSVTSPEYEMMRGLLIRQERAIRNEPRKMEQSRKNLFSRLI